jgi:eukaryotic-like serine/threonine-protein kinase
MQPANMILCGRGRLRDTVKVLDFGPAKDVTNTAKGPAQTEVHALIGTPLHMSPEAIASPDLVAARSDLYAVGAIGYVVLTGETVFPETSFVAIKPHVERT